jgi:conjugative transposon TraM protein
MKINLRQPKYVLPLVLLPFLCLFFYVWRSGFGKPKQQIKENTGLNHTVGNVSSAVKKKQLADKLDAYRNTFKESDGLSAVGMIPNTATNQAGDHPTPTDSAKQKLDSVRRVMNLRFNSGTGARHDRRLAQQLNTLAEGSGHVPATATVQPREKDPMDVFKTQMAYIDSVSKQNDPLIKAEKQKKEAAERSANLKAGELRLPVFRVGDQSGDFNTVTPGKSPGFINAVIDQNITGYAGSRIRLRLLEDILAGKNTVKKGTCLYAQVSGFSQQRVTLTVSTILSEGRILPVRLELYDLDGLPGLYIPSSAFRDFTKDLGNNSVQGVSLDGSSGGSQFLMSSVNKVFQSTSSAIAELIRKNKAKLKYNSYIYLIDHDALLNTQKNY